MRRRFLLVAIGMMAAVFVLASCHSNDAASVPSQEAVNVSLNLPSATVNVSGQMQFTGTVTGTTNTGVTWSVNDIPGGNSTVGIIDINGLYTAPATVPSPATVTVKATSVADTTKSATSTVTIQASAGFLPGTGQTASYATGDDGDLRTGTASPNPRFTAGTGSEDNCVRDNLTGLMWVKSPDSTKRTWPDALTHANGLSLCGYNDWRLPNRKELWSLIDRSKVRPPISDGHPFTNVQADLYWTSTSFYFGDPSADAWHFSLSDGSTSGSSNKVSNSYYVWRVRSGQIGAVALPKTGQTVMFATGDDGDLEKGVTWPSPRFIAGTGSEVACVTDNLTGLMWVQSPDQVQRTWQQALDYANGLSLCGFDDWRLPNINDLESVTNQGEPCTSDWLNTQGFGNLVSAFSIYWSSTTYADNADLAWRVGLCSGNVAGLGKNESWYVWPVRSVLPQSNIVLNSVPLHLGNSVSSPPLHGLEFTWIDNVNSAFSSATLSVQFLGAQTNWGTNNATINGVDMPSIKNPFGTRVQLLVNDNTWAPLYSDFPNIPACISYWNSDPELPSYDCPFVFTIDIKAFLVQGQNRVIVRSNGDDFVIKDVTIRLN